MQDQYKQLPSQFVNWIEVPQAGKKPRKVPCDTSGALFPKGSDAHLNPANWLTYDQVGTQPGLHKAYVLGRHGETPPQYSLFLLDLDDCRDVVSGAVEPWAADVLSRFPNAFVEVSHSGTGFHVIGYCQPALMGTDRRKKFSYADSPPNALEFYTEGRFIALGRDGQGDLNLDWSAVLVDLVPFKTVTDLPAVTGGAPDDYTGPEDDDALLQIIARDTNYDALQPRRIPASAFYSDMETLRGMCHAAYGQDTTKAAPFDYDASSVDMTLLNHLAYYTGGDVARMERLFMRSLMGQRNKSQKRPQYVRDTANSAAGLALKDGRYLKQVTADHTESLVRQCAADDPAAISRAADALSKLPEADRAQVLRATSKDIAKRLTAEVRQRHDTLRVDQGKHAMGMLKQGELSNWFIVSNENGSAVAVDRRGGTSPQSKTAFVEARAHLPSIPTMDSNGKVRMISAAESWWTDPDTERYEYQSFNPAQPDKYTDEYGRVVRNTYRPAHTTPATAGDVEPYMYIMRCNIPNESDQAVLLSALAFAVQRPAEMLLWAPVVQGVQGSGKGTIVKKPLVHALGHNLGVAGSKQLAGDYNGYMWRKTAVVVDEIGEHSKATIAEIADGLKEPVAESPVPYRIMRKDPFDDVNYTVWFFLTNHMNSMLANDLNERRYAHFVSAIQTPEQVSAVFHDGWWQENYPHIVQLAGGTGLDWFRYYQVWWDSGGAEAVRAVLEQYPAAMPGRAPITTTRSVAEAAGEPEAVTQIREAVAAKLPGFRNGFVSSIAIRELMKSEGLRAPAGRWLNEAMKRLGYIHNTRCRRSAAESIRFPSANDEQMRVYYADGSLVGRAPVDLIDYYDQAQAEVSTPVQNNVVPLK